jgi:hypothetical protein
MVNQKSIVIIPTIVPDIISKLHMLSVIDYIIKSQNGL